jgi:YbgC/YbaW family acyl-CoA thioester hydrolase
MNDGERPASIRIQRRIEWSDTDASGRYHNTAAFRMLEWAETALLERLGILDEVYGSLPRVHVSADFRAPLDHRDLVDVDLRVEEVGRSSISYAVEITHRDEVCVEVRFVAALVGPDGRPRAWDAAHRRLLLTAGPQPGERLVSGNVAPEGGGP